MIFPFQYFFNNVDPWYTLWIAFAGVLFEIGYEMDKKKQDIKNRLLCFVVLKRVL